MPFAGYTDFADCVAKNSDKTTPEAFCAWLEHRVTGLWPSQSQASMPEEAWTLYGQAYIESRESGHEHDEAVAHAEGKLTENGWQHSRFGYLKQFEAPKMRAVVNVPIFSVGTWTDSSGIERTWTEEDLLGMVKAFNAGIPSMVPLKAGHTTDDFNSSLAEALDVPVGLITGENLGNGAVSLGRMKTLELKGNMLFGAFERVPDKVADMIESAMYNSVSAEIEEMEEWGGVITGIALLGAELPAVDSAQLDRAMVFGGKRDKASVLTFSKQDLPFSADHLQKEFDTLKGKMADFIKGMRGAPIFRAMLSQLDSLFKSVSGSNHQEDKIQKEEYQEMNEEQLKALAAMLGLEEAATIEDVMEAIKALVEKVAAAPPATEQTGTMAAMEAKLQAAEETIKKLTHTDTVSKYSKVTAKLTAIEGTPEEMAEELAGIEETQGVEAAEKILGHYQKANDINQKAMQVLGTEARGDVPEAEHPFETKVKEYAEANKLTFQKALAALSTQDSKGFAEYRRAKKPQ